MAVPLIGAQPALADETTGVAEITDVTVGEAREVTVEWTVADGGGTAPNNVRVDITGPNGAVTGAGKGTCLGTANLIAAEPTMSCEFTAGAADGDYTIVVTPVHVGTTTNNGTASAPETVEIRRPVGKVSALTATATDENVEVGWSLAGITWNEGDNHDLKVAITPSDKVGATDCDEVTDASDSCSFTAVAAAATTYTVKVTATTDHGDSNTFATKTVVVSAPSSAPTGGVSDLTLASEDGVVEVSWDPDGVTSWGNGDDAGFDVIVSPADDIGANTCDTTDERLATTSTGCEFTPTAADTTYTVTVTPANTIGDGTAVSESIVVSAIGPTGTFGDSVDATEDDGPVVTVVWDASQVIWGEGEDDSHVFDVVVDPDTIEDDGTCTTGLAMDVDECTFTATAAGDYTVTVTARNSVGSGVSDSDEVEVEGSPPVTDAQELSLEVTLDPEVGARVNLAWDKDGVTSWGLSENPGFAVTVAGGGVGANDCGMDTSGAAIEDDRLPITAEACSFTATDETTYTVTLTPVNDEGESVVTASDTAVTTETVPDADEDALDPAHSEPSDNGVITVTWTEIDDANWGSGDDRAIDVTVNPPGVGAGSGGAAAGACAEDMPADTTECTFTPAQGGTYTVTLTPKTEMGSGIAVTLDIPVEATAPSDAVSDLEATVSGSTVTVDWDLGTVNWGTGTNRVLNVDVTGGDVGASTCTATMVSTATSCQFTALEAATYTISVMPSTSEGDADSEEIEAEVTTLSPNAPTDVEVTAGESELMVSWTAGEDNGIEVTYYTVTANPGGVTCSTADADSTECTISGLTPGTPYEVTVVAKSATGESSEESDVASGTPMGASPSGMTARNANGQLQMFARAADGSVVTSVQDENGDWGAWASLGGGIIGEPVVFRNANGQLQLLVIGLNNAVWQRQQTSASGNAWSEWASTGTSSVRSIAVELNTSDQAVIVSRGTDNAVWVATQAAAGGTSWTWASLGGGVTGDPRLVVHNDGTLEVVARGLDFNYWHRVQTGSGWSEWAKVGSASSAA